MAWNTQKSIICAQQWFHPLADFSCLLHGVCVLKDPGIWHPWTVFYVSLASGLAFLNDCNWMSTNEYLWCHRQTCKQTRYMPRCINTTHNSHTMHTLLLINATDWGPIVLYGVLLCGDNCYGMGSGESPYVILIMYARGCDWLRSQAWTLALAHWLPAAHKYTPLQSPIWHYHQLSTTMTAFCVVVLFGLRISQLPKVTADEARLAGKGNKILWEREERKSGSCISYN